MCFTKSRLGEAEYKSKPHFTDSYLWQNSLSNIFFTIVCHFFVCVSHQNLLPPPKNMHWGLWLWYDCIWKRFKENENFFHTLHREPSVLLYCDQFSKIGLIKSHTVRRRNHLLLENKHNSNILLIFFFKSAFFQSSCVVAFSKDLCISERCASLPSSAGATD